MGDLRPFFSVIVPVYNRAPVLGRALRSVLRQTWQDFEIVVVDDGSHDDPEAVIAALDDPRIRYIRQTNRGGGAARNAGLDAAQGLFVAPLDSDDEFLPDHLERMQRLLSGTTNLAGYARVLVDRGNGRTLLKPPRALQAGEHMATYLLCDRGFVPTITLSIERDLARRVRYHETLRFGEDTDFAIRLYLAGCRFTMLEEPGAVWHDHADAVRTSAGRKGARMLEWIEQLRPNIPAVAYHGCRGWTIAKGIAPGNRLKALRLYLTALAHRCYKPRLAAVVFLQIFLPDGLYRRIADRAIGWLALRRVFGSKGGRWTIALSTEPTEAC